MNREHSIGTRIAAWCAADDPELRCGTGPLARYLYFGRLLVRGLVRLPKPRRSVKREVRS